VIARNSAAFTHKNKSFLYLRYKIYKISSSNTIFINILMIFGIKEKLIILTLIMYCWLLPQIYPCYT